jgi:hypothetical protein
VLDEHPTARTHPRGLKKLSNQALGLGQRPYNEGMAPKPKTRPKGPWTAEEIAREERATRARALNDRQRTPEERLEETLRLSRFISELRQGAPGDVRTG